MFTYIYDEKGTDVNAKWTLRTKRELFTSPDPGYIQGLFS